MGFTTGTVRAGQIHLIGLTSLVITGFPGKKTSDGVHSPPAVILLLEGNQHAMFFIFGDSPIIFHLVRMQAAVSNNSKINLLLTSTCILSGG